jgi:hypothetical protein
LFLTIFYSTTSVHNGAHGELDRARIFKIRYLQNLRVNPREHGDLDPKNLGEAENLGDIDPGYS